MRPPHPTPPAVFPSLPELPGREEWPLGPRRKQARLHQLLASAAARLRGDAPQPFYPMRVVAERFGVSLWTVQAVYRRLEQEGLLACIRGPGSVIPARVGATRAYPPGRGVVVVPVWLPGFILIADYRFFVMHLDDQIRRRNFVADIVFYGEEEKSRPLLAGRIRTHHPDVVVWLRPGTEHGHTIDQLADAGIRVLTVTDVPVSERARQYEIDWRPALRAVLRHWRQQGVRRVVVPVDARPVSSCTRLLPELVREAKLAFSHFRARSETMQQYLFRLARQSAAIVFDDDIWHARTNSQAPVMFARVLASSSQVLNLRSFSMRPDILTGIRADALVLPWRKIVNRIVNDLNAGRTFPTDRSIVFAAAWRRRRPAAEFTLLHAYEAL
jgi:hypothetical protein